MATPRQEAFRWDVTVVHQPLSHDDWVVERIDLDRQVLSAASKKITVLLQHFGLPKSCLSAEVIEFELGSGD